MSFGFPEKAIISLSTSAPYAVVGGVLGLTLMWLCFDMVNRLLKGLVDRIVSALDNLSKSHSQDFSILHQRIDLNVSAISAIQTQNERIIDSLDENRNMLNNHLLGKPSSPVRSLNRK